MAMRFPPQPSRGSHFNWRIDVKLGGLNMGIRVLKIAALAALAAVAPSFGQEQDQVGRIVDRIVEGEREFLARIKTVEPYLETYIQEFEPRENGSLLVQDHYMLGKLDLSKGVTEASVALSAGFQKRARGKRTIRFLPAGWAQMTIPDAFEFNRSAYTFEYARREFLGEVRCLVFNVAPQNPKAAGKFIGTIWVEDQDYRIVRFNGTYTRSKSSALFFHFDSWRVNVAPDFWAPAFVYVEEAAPTGKEETLPRFKAQTRIWGYNPVRNSSIDELSSIQVESQAKVLDKSGSMDVTPVEGQRLWEKTAEQNVLLRLEKGSLLAPKGEVDEVLNTVVNNLIATNGLNLDVSCRVLLTTPFETFSIGHTIVISRGLLDVLPDEGSLAMVLAEELAHIALGHRTATSYAFGDQTMFSDTDLLQRLNLARSPQEIAAAASKAIDLLSNSPYKTKLATAGLFLKLINSRVPALQWLVKANLGNQFASEVNIQKLAELANQAPPLEENKLEQIAALPLGSRIKVNVWTNQISMIKTGPLTFLSAREKMPLEVTPIMIPLTRVAAQADTAASGTKPQTAEPAVRK